MSIIMHTDSYKISHWCQYPPNTTKVYSYLEARGGKYNETVFFGLHYLLKNLSGIVVSQEDINEADKFFSKHFLKQGLFNRKGWEHIVKKHHGNLPVRIKAVPEGSVVKTGNVLMTIENTDPECYWLTNYLETLLSQVWYPTTVASQSRQIKKVIARYLRDTSQNLEEDGLDWKLHDFGFRGTSSLETSAIGSAAHLVNFKGTDTLSGVVLVSEYYQEEMAGFSVPAAEHSTITSWGRENEVEAYRNMLNRFGDTIVAVVSDSYDIYHACSELWGNQLKDQIMNMGGTLVIRPDSGYPPDVLLKVLEILGEKFGVYTNAKGYKVLCDKVRIIQGDGINLEMVQIILHTLKENGWSAANLAFGSGGALLQKVDRDTLSFAFKCSYMESGGQSRDVWKDPITSASKKSKRGRLGLIRGQNGDFQTVSEKEADDQDCLELVFENGRVLREPKFSKIRELASIGV
jgi:nicotinamide phosphoribosyltransferase